MRILMTLILAAACLLQAQSGLDPANYPKALACDTTGLVAVYKALYRGTRTYDIHTTPPIAGTSPQRYLSPVIDGLLEDSVWFYAETLLVNSWEDAGGSACAEGSEFKGPRDIHAIWRFCYNNEGLFAGVEVHDDLHDVDSMGAWYLQDGIQLAITPWDFGDCAAGLWTPAVNSFRRFVSNAWTVVPYADGSHNTFTMVQKRLNEEPYLSGLIRSVMKVNYANGSEASNFTRGVNTSGIEFACRKQGADMWSRTVWHAEFKFPFHTQLWPELEGQGLFDANGLPFNGSLFKVNVMNSDDDFMGPNGTYGGVGIMNRVRGLPFSDEATGHDHWSDTRYHMVMKYAGAPSRGVAHIQLYGSHPGDHRITGRWVDVASETHRYVFTENGTVQLGVSVYNFDSTAWWGGTFTNPAGAAIGTYHLYENIDNNPLLDTIRMVYNGSFWTLVREIVSGYPPVEGRWVQARPYFITSGTCNRGTDTVWQPLPGTREFRFTPLSRLNINLLSYPKYRDCRDSLRIYDYASGQHIESYVYTWDKAIRGRTVQYFSYEFKKILRPEIPSSVRNLIVTYLEGPRYGQKDTLVEIKPYPLVTFGEAANNLNPSFMMYSALPQGTRQFWRLRVMDKYTHNLRIYPDSLNKTWSYPALLYNDMMMSLDSTSPNFWTRIFSAAVTLDSAQLVNCGVSSCELLPRVKGTVFTDRAFVQQTCKIRVNADNYGSPKIAADSFIFRDTTQVSWYTPARGETQPQNTINPGLCSGTEVETEASEVPVFAVFCSPNPFNPSTNLFVSVPAARAGEGLSLNVFNVNGRLVRTLHQGVVGANGFTKTIVWNGTDDLGRKVGAGIYVYRVLAGAETRQGKMILAK